MIRLAAGRYRLAAPTSLAAAAVAPCLLAVVLLPLVCLALCACALARHHVACLALCLWLLVRLAAVLALAARVSVVVVS